MKNNKAYKPVFNFVTNKREAKQELIIRINEYFSEIE